VKGAFSVPAELVTVTRGNFKRRSKMFSGMVPECPKCDHDNDNIRLITVPPRLQQEAKTLPSSNN